MFVYRYNEYTKKYYKYDSDDVDLFDPMFDEDLHDNNLTSKHNTKCLYCNTEFHSRNQLYHHLGYMNIDIRKDQEAEKDEYDIELGDFGIEPTTKRRKKTSNSITKSSSSKKQHSKATQVLIAELIRDLKI